MGSFAHPCHIIRMMVQMIDPKPRERIGDLAAGTAGFLVNAYQHILETHTSPNILEYDAEGASAPPGGRPAERGRKPIYKIRQIPEEGFDNDSGMTMLRIGSMNLILHGIEAPRFYYTKPLIQKPSRGWFAKDEGDDSYEPTFHKELLIELLCFLLYILWYYHHVSSLLLFGLPPFCYPSP